MEFVSISWVLWRSTFTKAMRIATLEDNKRDIILNDIAPTLRVAEPLKVPNYEDIQKKYELKRRKYIDSQAQTTTVQNTVSPLDPPSKPLSSPDSLNKEENAVSHQSLHSKLSVLTTEKIENQHLAQLQTSTSPGTNLQQKEIEDYVVSILEDRYAAAKIELIQLIRDEVAKTEEKWNEHFITMYQGAMAACDQKCDRMLIQLRQEIRRNSKSLPREEMAATVEIGPEVVVEKPQENEQASDGDMITFPLFYLPNSGKLADSVTKLRRRETELLPMYKLTCPHSRSDTFIKVQLDDAMNPGPADLVLLALFVLLPGVPIIVGVAQGNGLTMLYSIPTLLIVTALYYLYSVLTRERQVLERFSKACSHLTDLSPILFGKQVHVQMVKSVENKITGLASNQLFKIKDGEGNEHSTAVYFTISLRPDGKIPVS